MENQYRTHTCGELCAKDIGKKNENLEGKKEEVALPSKAKEKLKKVILIKLYIKMKNMEFHFKQQFGIKLFY